MKLNAEEGEKEEKANETRVMKTEVIEKKVQLTRESENMRLVHVAVVDVAVAICLIRFLRSCRPIGTTGNDSIRGEHFTLSTAAKCFTGVQDERNAIRLSISICRCCFGFYWAQ